VSPRDPRLLPGEIDRILALEEDNCFLRRELEAEEEALRQLERRVRRLDEYLIQTERDVKDAHDRIESVEDRVAELEERQNAHEGEDMEGVDEQELGEAGA
jgi:septal ring factor EnvC (AmiA/AmiB activator)